MHICWCLSGVELGFNYPLPLISMDAAKDSVKKASSIIERCTSSKSTTTSGHSSGSVLPRKEPYRPPTDPALLAALLGAAAEEFAGWDLREGLTGLELLQPSEWTSGECLGACMRSCKGWRVLLNVACCDAHGVPPRKEPYRAPTDPALLAMLLMAAAEQFVGWGLREGLTGLELSQPSEWTSGECLGHGGRCTLMHKVQE